MRRRVLGALALIAGGIAGALPAGPAAATPACDLLRLCSAALADEMAGGPGAACGGVWPARVIAQYRRMSVSDFEGGGAAHACGPTFQAIAHNALMFHQTGRLCRLPIACKPENADDLPALPGE